ncbi:MAG: hypothetical protein GX234_04330 [Clostridiales bacterium]|nr:hypothetical protein [Clostridiales bacterium]
MIASMNEVELLSVRDKKTIEREYRETIQKNDCMEWIRLIKTIQYRKKRRNQNGIVVKYIG